MIKSNRKSKIFFSLGGSRTRIFSSRQSLVRSQSMRCGSSSHERTTQRLEKKRYACSFSFIPSVRPAARRIGDQISLSRASSSQTSIRVWRIRYGRRKIASSSRARLLCEKNTPMMRSVVLKRKKERKNEQWKNTHLNLGGLEAGDGRDLLSSSKH